MARVAGAVVDVDLARGTRVSRRAFAGVARDQVMAYASVLAWLRFAVVDVDLAARAFKARLTRTFERVDHVVADAAVQAWIGGAFININFALCAGKAWNEMRRKKLIIENQMRNSKFGRIACPSSATLLALSDANILFNS